MIPLRDDNPTELAPVLVLGLIAACVLVFLWQISLGEAQRWLVTVFGVTPAVLLGDKPLPHALAIIPPFATVFTSMFLHGSFMHVAGNILFLWIFGNNVEDAMGHVRFILFYFMCGVAAVYAQALPDPDSFIPMIGASGAISGVLGAYLLLYPHARVLVAIPLGFVVQTLTLKAVWVLGLWFALQLISTAIMPAGQGGVAFGAHAGGFVAGMLLVPFMRRRGVRLFNRPPR